MGRPNKYYIHEDRRNRLAVAAQESVNFNIMNKRILSEVDGMDVDDDISHKKIKTHPQDEQIISKEIFQNI